MPVKDEIRYEINPSEIEAGKKWLTVEIENNSLEELVGVSVELHSTDSNAINILGSGDFVPSLSPNEEALLSFQVRAMRTADEYIVLDGEKGNFPYYWVSP